MQTARAKRLYIDRLGRTLLSMVISVVFYKFFFSWVLAIGLVIMMFIHEMGHVWAAKVKHVSISDPVFVPLIGAVMTFRKLPENAPTEAFIAYGGPLVGTIGATLFFIAGMVTQMQELLLIAFVGFILNLFNLIPLAPLDGGRIVTAVSRWLWALGFVLAIVFIYWTKTYLLTVVLMLFIWEFRYLTYRDENKRWEWRGRIKVPKGPWSQGMTAEELKRVDLTWRQYCSRREKAIITEIVHPAVGTVKRLYEGQFLGKVLEIRWRKIKEKRSHYLFFFQLFFDRDAFRDETYYQVSPQTRVKFAGAYLGLILFLLSMIYVNTHVIPLNG